jgi:hypothetical protein
MDQYGCSLPEDIQSLYIWISCPSFRRRGRPQQGTLIVLGDLTVGLVSRCGLGVGTDNPEEVPLGVLLIADTITRTVALEVVDVHDLPLPLEIQLPDINSRGSQLSCCSNEQVVQFDTTCRPK